MSTVKILAVLFPLLSALVAAAPEPTITPFAALLQERQSGNGENCGYINANVLSGVGCSEGSTCAANPTYNVAGGCCRLGDNANCILPTQCVPQAALSASCDSACSSNSRITKCTDSASPYCYTRYWVSGGNTPTELGCTTQQGYFAYAYTTYTFAGQTVSFDVASPTASPASPSSTIRSTGAAASSSAGSQGGGSTGQSNSGSSSASGSDSGSSTPIGAFVGGVIGGVAVLGIITALIVWIVLRHRRSVRAAQDSNNQNSQYQGAGEKPWQGQSPVSPMGPHPGFDQPNGPQEIATRRKRHELHQQQVVPEMP